MHIPGDCNCRTWLTCYNPPSRNLELFDYLHRSWRVRHLMLSTQVRNLKVHEGAIHVVKYNTNGGYFLSGGQDRRIILQNASTGAQIKTYEAHGTRSYLIEFSRIVQAGKS